MGEMHVLCSTGDIVVEWDAGNPEAVAKAQEEWARLKADGYEFFESVESKGKRITRFSKSLGRVIAAPGIKKSEDKKTGKREKSMAGGPNASIVTRPRHHEDYIDALLGR